MKKIKSFVLCVVLVLGFVLPCTAFATEEEAVIHEARVYESLQLNDDGTFVVSENVLFEGSVHDAVNYVNLKRLGGAIVLSENIKLTQGITLQPVGGTTAFILIDGDVQIDLNGHFITQIAGSEYSENPLVIVPKNSTLTITDFSSAKHGSVNAVQTAVDVNGGHFDLLAGFIEAQSRASAYPDEYELPVKIRNSGRMAMSGGTIEYSGSLEDGRLYSEESCGILGENAEYLHIYGGTIYGGITFDDKADVWIGGGNFGFDVSEYINLTRKMEYNEGLYSVVEVLNPEINMSFENKVYLCDVTLEGENLKEQVEKISVNTVAKNEESDHSKYGKAKVDLTEILKAAKNHCGEEIPVVAVESEGTENFNFKLEFDSENVEMLADVAEEKSVFLEVEMDDSVENGVLEKIKTAKSCFVYRLVDEDGNVFNNDVTAEAEIYYPTYEKKFTMIYHESGDSFYQMAVEENGDWIAFELKEDKSLVIAEGEVLEIVGKTLDIEGTITMVFYADIQGVDATKARMLFWDAPQEKYTVETASRSVSYSSKNTVGYLFEYENIPSKEMNKKIYARIVATDKDGQLIYSEEPEGGYSIVDYAMNMMEKSTMKQLLIKMLNYGTSAQEYFGTDDEPANSKLPDEVKIIDYDKEYKNEAKIIEETSVNGESTAKIAGKTLTLEGDVAINYYVLSEEPVDEMGILFWTEKSFESNSKHILGTQSKRISEHSVNGDYIVFSYDNIYSSELFEPVYARVYTKKDNVYKYGSIDKYSVKDYAAKQIEQNENQALIKLLRSLLLYGEEAMKYFS